jgi:hypothetical protein
MEAIVMFLAVIIGLIGLDLAALRWGVDSRSSLQDDHHR